AALPALVACVGGFTVVAHRDGSLKARHRWNNSQHIENSKPDAVTGGLSAEVDATSSADQEIGAACAEAIALQQLGGRAGELQGSCGIRSRHGAVRTTERALTRTNRPVGR